MTDLEGFGPRHVPWDRAAPRRVEPAPTIDAPEPSPRGGNALADLDWFFREGPTLLGHSLPLEWVPASTTHDDDGMSSAHVRYGGILRRLARVNARPNGPLLVWVLRAWHGGSAGMDRPAGCVESYRALLLGASDEEHERRVLMAQDRLDTCEAEVKRLNEIVNPPAAPKAKDEAKGTKKRGRRRRRNVAAESPQRASISDEVLQLRLAKRAAAEAREVVRVQRANDAARALIDVREEWSALADDEQKRRVSSLHSEAVRAYLEAR